MSVRTQILDRLASPELLPAREKVRAARRLVIGTTARIRRTVSSGTIPGLLSIVVPMYGVERYIGECLESLQRQNYENVQIVVVDDGSPDRSYEVARRYARRDPRIEIVRQPNGGLSAARNTGIRHARGEYLAFLDSDDFVDRHAYSDAIETLTRTGSDFAVMPYRRERNGGYPPAGEWVRAAHAQQREATNIAEFPDIMVNAVAWSKVYRREFWDAHGFTFPVGLLYEDQAVSMAAYAAAKSFDVLSRISINWRIRSDQTSITQQLANPRNIVDHFVAVRDSLAQLERFGAHEAAELRVLQNVNNNLGEFLPNIGQMGSEAWEAFRDFLTFLSEHMTPEMWREVEARKKILIGLCVADERDLAQRFLAERGWHRDLFGGELHGDTLRAEVPLQNELVQALPDQAFVYSESETHLTAVFRRARMHDGALQVDLLAFINHLKIDTETTELAVSLETAAGERFPLTVTRSRNSADSLGHTRRYADISVAAATVEIPGELLLDVAEFRMFAEMRCGELSRASSVILDVHSEFSLPMAWGTAGQYLAVEGLPDAAARFVLRSPDVRIVSAELTGSHASIEFASDRAITHAALVRADDRLGLRRSMTRLVARGAGAWQADLQVPELSPDERGPVEYLLVVQGPDEELCFPYSGDANVTDRGSRLALTPRLHTLPGEYAEQRRLAAERPGALDLAETTAGRTLLVDLTGAVLVTDAQLVDAADQLVDATDVGSADAVALQLSLREPHGGVALARANARSGSAEVPLTVARADGATVARLPLRRDVWGLGDTGLKRGLYRFQGTDSSGAPVRLYVAPALRARQHRDLQSALGRISVRRSPRDLLRIVVSTPLHDDELGEGTHWRLRDESAHLVPDQHQRTVLFRNRYGEDANDSALAVYRELQRRGTELELIWTVRDASIWVPDGAQTVWEESREYYEAFRRANYVMVNVHQPEWYRKSAGQVLIQTHHGYPFKLQGRRWWDRLGDSAERQESLFRRADEWDYLVSPAAYATAPLTEFYRSSEEVPSQILEIGYPRNDALLDEHAPELRADTRARLGIGAATRVILYAPTYRDYLSADQMSADIVPKLIDFARLSDALGDDYVILMRGHPFNAGADIRSNPAFINVTDYPDINHLILASDLAILDYSSLRFDYALTGKPSLFFVPDLERYFAGRESFVPYAETSPGPHLSDQDELVRAIQDAEAIAREYEPARLEFIANYMEEEDGHAAARLVDAVFAPNGDA